MLRRMVNFFKKRNELKWQRKKQARNQAERYFGEVIDKKGRWGVKDAGIWNAVDLNALSRMIEKKGYLRAVEEWEIKHRGKPNSRV